MLIYKEDGPLKRLVVDGLLAAQMYGVIKLLKKLPEFELAIEIGTCRGAFALAIKKYLKCEVHTIDIKRWDELDLGLLSYYDVHFHDGDCFHNKQIEGLVKDDRKKIVFCDGGHKITEMSYFSGLINKGDYIGAHDFFINKEDNKEWTTCEIELKDVEHLGLQMVYNEYAWGIFKK